MKFNPDARASLALDGSSENWTGQIEKAQENPWRQKYHIQPPAGSMNALDGFVYYEGKYHILYQWAPFYTQGRKYLYHVVSDDLAVYHNLGIVDALPDGADSGSASVMNDMHVYRTIMDGDTSLQHHTAFREEAGGLRPLHTASIIKGAPEGYAPIVKDPKVWKENGRYCMIMGAATKNDFGRVLCFTGTKPEAFDYIGELKTELDQFGFMWESPELFELDGFHILMFCPQGLDKYQHSYWNIYQSGYVLGRTDMDKMTMKHGDFHELDQGFDFYAPETTQDASGNRYIIGWMGMKETVYPTDGAWSHCLTLPRTLSIENGVLKQRPAAALAALRTAEMTAEGYFDHRPKKMKDFYGDSYELTMDILENTATQLYINLRVSRREQTSLIYDSGAHTLALDTTFSGEMPENVDGTVRTAKLDAPLFKLQIFVDVSSIEIFINDGAAVMTARIFPSEKAEGVELSTEMGNCHVRMSKYELKSLASEPTIQEQ
ncbi:glycoside hydrolase family 32 protein [Salinicoccus hispanicus]|uniref:Sucrose-6-phosphate hydrolase n=1 Tax=Salinicoccus hispanicus TaxID=157225 RepID=A0A6N8U6H7_9STAP|nr:sucrose-6-phosphate hydrolase [Salinicoccus hispanicus]MXQ52145.1 sucrose-6-phosphate hydrolase [Salinicoccus hispanicus]